MPRIVCPSSKKPDHCLFDETKQKCVKPDPYQEFARVARQKKWTKEQIEAHWKINNERESNPILACRRVRNRIGNRTHSITKLLGNDGIRSVFIPKIRPKKEGQPAKRIPVYSGNYKMIRKKLRMYIRRALGLKTNELDETDNQITERLCDVIHDGINKYWFKGTLHLPISDIRFHVIQSHEEFKKLRKRGKVSKDSDNAFAVTRWNPKTQKCVFQINSWMFYDLSGRLMAGDPVIEGRPIRTAFDYLITTIEHEFVHLFMYLYAPSEELDSLTHGSMFLRLSHHFFGHPKSYAAIRDDIQISKIK